MATRSNLQRLLRASISHRNATALLNLHPSPTSFLHSNPSNLLPISKPHLFSSSISRRVHTRATALQNPLSISDPSNLPISNPHSFPSSISRRVHTRANALHKRPRPYSSWTYALNVGFLATGGMIILYIFLEKKPAPELKGSVNDEKEYKFQGSLPNLYRKKHSVVVEGLVRFRPKKDNVDSNVAGNSGVKTKRRGYEFFLLATEVLAQPQQVAAALERNNIIFAEKQKAEADWNKTQSDKISESAVEDELALDPDMVLTTADLLKGIFSIFRDMPDLLREGNSVFIKGFPKRVADENKEDKLDGMKEDKLDGKDNKSDGMKDNKSDEMMKEDEPDEIKEDEMKVSESDEIKEAKSNDTKEAKWTKTVTGKTYQFSAEVVYATGK